MATSQILLVEDEQLVARTMAKQLMRANYTVLAIAATGEEAIQLATELLPDLVLMDIKLSGKMDGITAAEHIRARIDVPIVYITAYTDEATLERAKVTEPFGYVVKPFTDKDLSTTIEMALYKHQLDKKLRASEARYRALSELTSDFAYSVRVESDGALFGEWATEAFASVVALDIDGKKVPDRWENLIYPADLPTVTRHIDKLLTGEKDTCEFRLVSDAGNILWIRNYARPEWRAAENRVVRILGAAQDITERKRVERALQESEQKFRLLYEDAPLAYQSLDEEGRFLEANAAWLETLGYSRAEVIGRSFSDFMTPPYAASFKTRFSHLKAAGEIHNVEIELICKDGTPITVSFDGSISRDAVGNFTRTHCIFHDITARQRAETALRRSEFEKSLILSTVTDMVAFYEQRDLAIVWTNKASADSVGLTVGDLIGKCCYEIWHHRAAPCVGCPVVKAFESGEYQETEMTTPDDRIWEIRAYPAKDEQGNLVGVVEIGHNITARKRAETSREEQRALLRQVLDINPNYIFVRDRAGRFTLANRTTAAFYGMTVDELIGKNIADLHPDPADIAKFQREDLQVMDTLQEIFIPEEPITYAAGGIHWHRTVKRPILDKDGTADQVLVITMDITARKQAEDALRRRTDELKRTAADLQNFAYIISHDLQEPLRMISSFLHLLQNYAAERLDAEATECIDYALDGAERLRTMIKGILAYSRVETRGKAFAPTASEAVLSRVLRNLKFMITEADAVITYDPLPTVQADETQLTQLFQNLISNAIKFRAAEPPRIHIAAEYLPRHHTGAERDRWRFAIRDNGIGIAPDQADRIFIMFQRLHTAEEYDGSGIGLAICKRIIERHGGQIWVESQPGAGATFYFTLPAGIMSKE